MTSFPKPEVHIALSSQVDRAMDTGNMYRWT